MARAYGTAAARLVPVESTVTWTWVCAGLGILVVGVCVGVWLVNWVYKQLGQK